ncbi:killer cell lectin-like receptor subfamily B member 1F isoform X11 [Cricetulus griseus]|nr:killer cell lectin-like receptor subfamily B member 1F isoform X11 [Cricetulus griseus]XP_027285590.1 killer cell lectin-like receptor subfamily B member 1F isoform X11 [Cricetulus griseus]XP_027285591.1 killer cell lectin-like receptor subfamily B member 1F isoform X11 [Cricetulus griseus]XP_027285592.1 killer cell lectin-like receptor subfamily B member 1F isoform X11 [Cricetulus griseus]XP_035304867.1 killer cell lectin-like receptor subfamily B member 1F isoform X11 [Cricetulus griseus]
MDTSRVYVNVKTFRTPGHKCASPPSLPPDASQCPHWHRLALKLGCVGLILLVLNLIGLSISVRFLMEKPPIEKHGVADQENRTEPTGRSAMLKCPRDWHLHQDKCLFISQILRPWAEGLADCFVKEATLLLLEDEGDMRFIQDISKKRRQQFFIGLNYVPAEKIWKCINASVLSPDICLSVPILASVGSETPLCLADSSCLEPDWTQCLRNNAASAPANPDCLETEGPKKSFNAMPPSMDVLWVCSHSGSSPSSFLSLYYPHTHIFILPFNLLNEVPLGSSHCHH